MTVRRGLRKRYLLPALALLLFGAAAVGATVLRRWERGLAEDRLIFRALGFARAAARLTEAAGGVTSPHLVEYGNAVGAEAGDVLRLVVADTGRLGNFGVRRGAKLIYALDGGSGPVSPVDAPLIDRANHIGARFGAGHTEPLPLAELVQVAATEEGYLRIGAVAPVVVNEQMVAVAGGLLRVPAVETPWPLLPFALASGVWLLAVLAVWRARNPVGGVALVMLTAAVVVPSILYLTTQGRIREQLATRAADWLQIQAMADRYEPVTLVSPIPGREMWSTDGALRLERLPGAAPASRLIEGGNRVGDERASIHVHPEIEQDLDRQFSSTAFGWGVFGFLLIGLCAVPLGRLLENLRRDPGAYAYTGPAVLGLCVLVVTPFLTGVGLAFYHYQLEGDASTFVGFGNFAEIIAPSDTADVHFWRTLAVTVLWTVTNVVLHVVIGLALALLLNRPGLVGKRIYRVLLVLPWAVPSYITALLWRSMFLGDSGPMNRFLGAVGVGPIRWFDDHFWTNFIPNLVTNTWLGFPFMMVVALGALQSIPGELYEAAELDGASAWRRFRHITLPLLKPALLPAIILGTVWTFNLFNVIYLVSMGAGGTEILITEAYRTFHEDHRHGYAAAYSVMIFLILLGYTWVTTRVTRATDGAIA